MSDTSSANTYNLDNIPEDATAISSKGQDFAPLEDGATYQVEIKEIQLKDNIFYKPDNKDSGSKYVFGFTLVILDDGEFRGRRIWDNCAPVIKPDGKKGATKLYKIVNKALNANFDWDMCASFAPDMKTLYKNLMDNVLGRQIKVTVESTIKDDGKNKVKIAAYSVAKVPLESYVSEKDADTASLNTKAPAAKAPEAPKAADAESTDWLNEAEEFTK